MSIRQAQKLATRERILAQAKILFIGKGLAQTSTTDISTAAKVANGTIFMHFGSRENLLAELFEIETKRMARAIITGVGENGSPRQVLDAWLDTLAADEDFQGVLLREMPFLPESIRHLIVGTQVIMRNVMFRALRRHGVPETAIRMILDTVFALVEHYLRLKPVLTGKEPVIPRFRGDITSVLEILTAESVRRVKTSDM